MAYVKKIHGTIKSLTSLDQRKTLIIFFPPAGTDSSDFKDALEYWVKNYDVIFVEEGYFGLVKKKDVDENYSRDIFSERFYEHYKKILDNYANVILIGQSFGSILALKLKQMIPHAKVILVSPPVSIKKFKFHPVDKVALNLMLKTSLGKKIIRTVEEGKFTSIGRLFSHQILLAIQRPLKRAGIKSYLNCLNEIVNFGIVDPKLISNDTILFLGRNDVFINTFCNQEELKKRKKTYIINATHSILQSQWKRVTESFTIY